MKKFISYHYVCPLGFGDILFLPGSFVCLSSPLCNLKTVQGIFMKLHTNNDQSDKMFLLTTKLYPQGVVSPCPGAIYMYEIMKKKCIKSDFKEIFFETCSKWPKWQEVSIDIKILSPGVSASDLLLETFFKSWKDVYKVRGWRGSF